MALRSRYNFAKLEELAQAHDITPLQPLPKLRLLTENDVPNFATPADVQRAEQCLLQGKSSKLIRKPTWRTKSRLESYEVKNITATLPALVTANEGAGVVQVLLNREHKIASIKDDNKRQAEIENRDALLQKAVEASDTDLVWLLASRTSLLRKNEALHAALTKRHSGIIKKLLEYGADPNSCSQQFVAAAASGDNFVVEHLLLAPLDLQQRVLIDALRPAVLGASLHIVQRIVAAADLQGSQELDAVVEATNGGQIDILLTILLSANSLRAGFLDKLVFQVFRNTSIGTASLMTILHALFSAGADGPESSAAMRIAVERQSTNFICLFAEYKVDINWGSGRIVQTAVQTGRCDLLHQVLSSGGLSNDNASMAVKALPRSLPPQIRLEMLQVLIEAGAYGEPVEQELVLAVQNNNQELVALLRARGVSVDNRSGDALIAAIQSDNVELLGQLLDGPVAQASLQNALPYVRSTGKSTRLRMTRLLADAKVQGEEVDIALRDAVCDESQDRDQDLMDVLLRANGDPAYGDAQSLRYAVQHQDPILLEKLLNCRVGLSGGVISSLLPQIMALENRDARLLMVKCVLAMRPSEQSVTSSLLRVVSEEHTDISLLKLIVRCGQADINHENGSILVKGALNPNIQVLEELMNMPDRTRNTTTNALIRLLEQKTFDDETKAVRTRTLLPSGRTSGIAAQGLLCYIRFWRMSGINGKDWPVHTFRILLDAGADINVSASILLDTTKAGALSLLQLLLTQKPSTPNLDTALLEAIKLDRATCLGVLQLILEANPTNEGISSALIQASQMHLDDICSLLFAYNPSLEHNDFAAIRNAVQSGRTRLVNMFLESKPKQNVIDAAFREAESVSHAEQKYQVIEAILKAGIHQDLLSEYLIDTVRQGTLEIVQLLLYYQADVHHRQNRSLVLASVRNRLDILQLLFSKTADKSVVATQCFEACVEKGLIQQEYISVLQFLLENGACGHPLDVALRWIVHKLPQSRSFLYLLEVLIDHGANVNYENGNALCNACETLGSEAILILMRGNPSITVRYRALHFLVKSTVPEADFCRTLDSLAHLDTPTSGTTSFPFIQEGLENPLRTLLSLRPAGSVELALFLKHYQPILRQPGFDNILSWALAQKAVRIHDECLILLINNGANVRHRDAQTGETVLLQAIRYRRNMLVKLILVHGADVSVPNDQGVSPLLLACELGDHLSATSLLEMGALRNDGSLHLAARNLYPDVVETLLKNGHNPNYPSPQAQGRTPLAELLYSAEATLRNHSTVERVIMILREHGANTERPISRKPLICWALDNKFDPGRMAEALLAAYLYEQIDTDFNLYISDGFCYSPTMYVAKLQYLGFKDKTEELVALLRNWGANKDVYYSLTGPQPDDAVGLPEDLRKVEVARRAKLAMRKEEEEELMRRRQLEEEDIRRRRRLEDEEFERRRRREEEEFERQVAFRRRLEAEDERISRQKNDLAISLSAQAESAKLRELQNRHTLQLNMQRDLAETEKRFLLDRLSVQERERKEELIHRTALSELELGTTREKYLLENSGQKSMAAAAQSALEAQVKTQKQLLSSQDHHNEKIHQRRMKQLTMEKAMPVGWAPSGGGFIEN